MKRDNHITRGSIFDDLQLEPEEAENLKIRARLMDALIAYVRDNNLSQAKAAQRLGVHQGRISHLMNGQITKFSIDALVNMLTHVGVRVRVDVGGNA